MASSKDYRNGNSLAVDAVQTFGGSVQDIDPALRAGKRERIELIAIDQIIPDARQPRRAVPRYVLECARDWQADVFIAWQMIAGGEMSVDFSINDALFAEGDPDEAAYGVYGRSLIELVNLARSIRKDGLINPITVYSSNEQYIVETGERRWWAYQMLRWLDGERWDKIAVRLVERPDAWRQAAENGARAQLTAIARARQYALLVMALHSDARFEAYDPEHDRAFYAQVATLRVPRGRAQDIMAAMGITSRSSLVQYRELLLIDDATWTRADDEGWSMRELFSALNNSRVGSEFDEVTDGARRFDEISQSIASADSPTADDGALWGKNQPQEVVITEIIAESSLDVVQMALWSDVDWQGWRKGNQRLANAARGKLAMSRADLLKEIAAQRKLLDALERKARGG